MCCHSLWHRTAERFENDLDDDQEHNLYLAHMKKWTCRALNFLLEALCKCYHTSSFRLQLGSALFHSRYVQGSGKDWEVFCSFWIWLQSWSVASWIWWFFTIGYHIMSSTTLLLGPTRDQIQWGIKMKHSWIMTCLPRSVIMPTCNDADGVSGYLDMWLCLMSHIKRPTLTFS